MKHIMINCNLKIEAENNKQIAKFDPAVKALQKEKALFFELLLDLFYFFFFFKKKY